jgi:hypothetical protein
MTDPMTLRVNLLKEDVPPQELLLSLSWTKISNREFYVSGKLNDMLALKDPKRFLLRSVPIEVYSPQDD